MATTKVYDDMVERRLREMQEESKLRELSGNVSSVKMTPEECAKEISAITECSYDANGSPVDVVMGAVADTVLPIKLKRGRPKGSRNKPKQ